MAAGLQVQDSSWVDENGEFPWLNVYAADLYSEYRALLTTAADAIHSLQNVSDVAPALGYIPLRPTHVVEGREPRVHRMPPGPNRWVERSRTLPGIAAAMAEQWGREFGVQLEISA